MKIIITLIISISLYAQYIQKGTEQYPITIEGQQGHEFFRGYSLDYGFFTSKHEFNPKKGIELLKVAVSKNDVLAMVDMYFVYNYGNYAEVDKDKAKKLLEKAVPGIEVLAKKGNIRAIYLLGNTHLYGWGEYKKNKKEAFMYFKKAADEGNAMGLYKLATCYRFDNYCGEKKDSKKSIEYYKQSSDKGYRSSTRVLGQMYYKGQNGLKKDFQKAKEYFKNSDGENQALNFLGHYYWYTKKDKEKAYEWYTKGAELGADYSHYNLARYWYFDNTLGKKDLKKAKYHFLEAQKRGVKDAGTYLAKLRTPTQKFYHKLISYKGLQNKEKISQLNAEPIFSNHKNIKISPNNKKVILNNKVYSLNPFKLIYEVKEKNLMVVDFFENDYLFVSTSKDYGLYSFRDKKFKYKHNYNRVIKEVNYSNGIARYVVKDKKSNKKGYKNTHFLFFKVTLNGTRKIDIKKIPRYQRDALVVNEDKTMAIIYKKPYQTSWDNVVTNMPSSIELLNLKNSNREYLSKMSGKCKKTNIRFLSKNSFACGQYLYNINTKQVEKISGEFILDEKQYLKYDYSKVGIYDMKTNKRLDETPFKDYVFNDYTIISPDKKFMVTRTSKDKMYNIYNVNNFLGNNKSKIINKIWIEADRLSKEGLKLEENELLSKALDTEYFKDIKIDSSNFKYQDNIVEVELDTFGKFTFKAEDIIKSLSDTYLLKNPKFAIHNNDIKLIAADLYPSDSGYILSFGRVPPTYKLSNKSIEELFKFSKKEEKKFKKAQKMLKADLPEEAEMYVDSLIDTNPIGLYYKSYLLKNQSWPISGKINISFKKAFLNYKKARLGIITDESKDSGTLIKQFNENSPIKNAGAQLEDTIVSLNGHNIIRKNDLIEILESLEEKNVEIEVIRNGSKIKLNVFPAYIVRNNHLILYNYKGYIRNSIRSGHPLLAKMAFEELEENIDNGTIYLSNKRYKEMVLVLKALVLSANTKEKEAFKILLSYDEEFDKSNKELVLDADYSYDLLKYPKRVAVVFDIEPNEVKKVKKYYKNDYIDLDGNLIKHGVNKKKVKKKLQANTQKGGVLE